MSAAGHAVYQTLRQHWPTARKIAIVCGPGDNEANGYVAAAAMHDPKVNLGIILYAENHLNLAA